MVLQVLQLLDLFYGFLFFGISLKFKIFTSTLVAKKDVPALPESILFFLLILIYVFLQKACSLPPLPINPIFILKYILYNLLMSKKKLNLLNTIF